LSIQVYEQTFGDGGSVKVSVFLLLSASFKVVVETEDKEFTEYYSFGGSIPELSHMPIYIQDFVTKSTGVNCYISDFHSFVILSLRDHFYGSSVQETEQNQNESFQKIF
jgi:hypothetical protein